MLDYVPCGSNGGHLTAHFRPFATGGPYTQIATRPRWPPLLGLPRFIEKIPLSDVREALQGGSANSIGAFFYSEFYIYPSNGQGEEWLLP